MKLVKWTAQNEDTMEDGILLEGRACFDAEMRVLEEGGAPVEGVVFVAWEATDRDESEITAAVPDAFHAWMKEQGMLEDEVFWTVLQTDEDQNANPWDVVFRTREAALEAVMKAHKELEVECEIEIEVVALQIVEGAWVVCAADVGESWNKWEIQKAILQ